MSESEKTPTGTFPYVYGYRVAWRDRRIAQLERERDDLEERLAGMLCDLTGGKLSKTGYDVRTMTQAVEEHFNELEQSDRDEAWQAVVEARKERDEARAEVESRIEDRDWFKARADRAEAALERVKALPLLQGHEEAHKECCGGKGYCDQCYEQWPCPTIQTIEGVEQ